MLAVVIICVVVIVALVTSIVRLRAHVRELTDFMVQTGAERDRAVADAATNRAAAESAAGERDDALERVNRARRDAADVANRLRDESAENEVLRRDLDEVRAALAIAEAEPPDSPASVLWDLSVRECEHRWRVSVAVDPDEESPLDGASDRFRAAVDVEVDAAREESGAALDLVWKGELPPGDRRAVVALAFVRDVIATHGTVASNTTITVDSREDGVEVQVDVTGPDGTPIDVPIPAPLEVEPGRALIS